jgi:hypothetical protein
MQCPAPYTRTHARARTRAHKTHTHAHAHAHTRAHTHAAPGGIEPNWLRYSYYTAGSGGAGPTILATTLLLAGEDVKVYKDGAEFILPPVSNRREVDFGPGIGRKGLYVYNLPETVSAYKYMKVRGSSARFGTDPFIW